MPENRDKFVIQTQAKGFTRAKLAQLQEIKKSQLDTTPQDKLHTDTLDHLKAWGTYAIAEMLYMILIMNYLNLLITTLFFFGPPTKNIV